MIFSSKKNLLKTKLLLLLFFTAGTVFAQKEHPSFEPLFFTDEILSMDNASPYTSWTAEEIFEIGLLFSECQQDSQTWNNCRQKFEAIKQKVTSDEIMSLSEEERGRAILKYLYSDYLKAYSLNQTKLDLALETGLYNCVSSAVLYLAAAKLAGLDVRGQRTTEHAFCSIIRSGHFSNKSR